MWDTQKMRNIHFLFHCRLRRSRPGVTLLSSGLSVGNDHWDDVMVGGGVVSSRQPLLRVFREGLQQASLEVHFRYFREHELQQKVEYTEDQVSEGTGREDMRQNLFKMTAEQDAVR